MGKGGWLPVEGIPPAGVIPGAAPCCRLTSAHGWPADSAREPSVFRVHDGLPGGRHMLAVRSGMFSGDVGGLLL